MHVLTSVDAGNKLINETLQCRVGPNQQTNNKHYENIYSPHGSKQQKQQQ